MWVKDSFTWNFKFPTTERHKFAFQKQSRRFQTLTECYQTCANQTESLIDVTTGQELQDASFFLYCRDAKRLLIHIETSDAHVANIQFIYLLIVEKTKDSFVNRSVYIVSWKSFFNLIRRQIERETQLKF